MTVYWELIPNVNNPGLGSSVDHLTTTFPATETNYIAPSAYRLATTHSSAPHSRVVKQDQRPLLMP